MQRYFTLEEAEALIPKLEAIFARIAGLKDRAKQRAEDFKNLESNEKADPVSLALARSQAEFMIRQIEEQLKDIVKLGGVPKGLDPCLVDFPHRMDGHEVYLCWQLGEKAIDYYHGLDEGFRGRKPVSGRALLKKIFGEE